MVLLDGIQNILKVTDLAFVCVRLFTRNISSPPQHAGTEEVKTIIEECGGVFIAIFGYKCFN
jgi:hypothetical protein